LICSRFDGFLGHFASHPGHSAVSNAPLAAANYTPELDAQR
jgi:hypothetical protein